MSPLKTVRIDEETKGSVFLVVPLRGSLCLFVRVRARCVESPLQLLNDQHHRRQLRQCAATLAEDGSDCLQNKSTQFVGKWDRRA